MSDRREEFKTVPWRQGRLLLTANVMRCSKEQRDEADDEERHSAFAHFAYDDEGRSRQHVYRFSTHEECESAVHVHNALLMPLSLDDDHPLWLINEQIKGLLEGDGAEEDHAAVVKFLLLTGLPIGTVGLMHHAIVFGNTKVHKL